MIRFLLIIGLSMSLVLFSGCRKQESKTINLNFSEIDTTIFQQLPDSLESYKVAIAAMISPKETFDNYQELINYLSVKVNHKIELVQRKTYQEVNNLLESGELDFAFICSGAYVELSSKCKIDILAVPQSNGKCLYQAYVIANKNSKINKFEDFKGKSFAYTDILSNTGRLYALKRVKELGANDKDYFSNIIYSNSHDNSIQLINNGIVDGATVDGLIYDFLKINTPEYTKNTVVIEKSEYFGIPPIVSRLDKKPQIESIRSVLLHINEDKVGRTILSKLLIDKFVPGYDSTYNSIRKIYNFVKK